ncbi:EMILIN-3 [Betta splendens]|uniref:EMILIN-3 n=1 Tax=Betta splendens TaxID=158456 RepID=A0A6P7N1B8_BETSP|nr:EMILIN-3 [Betta splendens]
MHFVAALSPFVIMPLFLSLVEAKFYRPFPFSPYKGQHLELGKPTSRHKNHCAYVVEKTLSFTVQDGVAPYVKAEYNSKCSWGKKCPTLLYRQLYKPVYKVAHKTVTELEWRCCPGFSGYDCMDGPPVYQHPMKSMPPFKGPPMKGPQFKGPHYKGPMLKGPPIKMAVKAVPWMRPKGPPVGGFKAYPMHEPSYPVTHFEPYPSESEVSPEHQEPQLTDHSEEHEQEPGHENEPSQGPEEQTLDGAPPPPSGGEQHEGEQHEGEQHEGERTERALDSETEERIYRMEEDVRRLNQGLETLRATVNGLEQSLRASLREDANRMLSALLSAAPGPMPAPVVASSSSTVGFVEIPGGDPQTEGLDGTNVFPDLTDLNGKIGELKTELRVKTAEFHKLKAMVMGHDGTLKKMSNGEGAGMNSTGRLEGSAPTATETMMMKMIDEKLSAQRADVLGGVEKRVESARGRCEEKAGDVRRQCQREQGEGRQQMEDALQGSTTDLRAELRDVQAQIHGLKTAGTCCGRMDGLIERVQQLETSVAGINQSQGHLRVELGGHKDHIEGILEGRLGYLEDKLNVSGQTGQGLESRLEAKLAALEGRLLVTLEELGNSSAPTLLEGHAVPALETELQSLRGKLKVDVDSIQKHLSGLEVLCSSSCSSTQTPPDVQRDPAEWPDVRQALHVQGERLDTLNVTLQGVLQRLALRQQQDHDSGELTILRFNFRSVNRTLRGLQSSLGAVIHKVGQANSSWHEREARLAQQMKGVVQLVGHQASMLGAGDRRLARLKGELQDVKRRLAEEVRGCQSAAMGVQKEVTEVGGRVAAVEGRCQGLNYLAEDLEGIREELEKQSHGLMAQVNGTLFSHAQQLSELRNELRNCSAKAEPTGASLELEAALEAEPGRGDTFARK